MLDPADAATATRRAALLRRWQTAATWVAGAGLLFGFLASIGLRIVPTVGPAWLWPLGALLCLAGAAGGLATVARGRQIDRERWEVVEDPLITSGEREYAHKEAERERRWAGTVFLTAPVALAYWSAYQVIPTAGAAGAAGGGSRLGNTPLLALLPLAGYVAGLALAHWRARRHQPLP